MNEVIIITMNWWQLSLFVICIALYGAFFAEFIPRILKKFMDKLEDKEEK